jgi:hypothetical protein
MATELRLKLSAKAVANFDSTSPLQVAPSKVSFPSDKRTDRIKVVLKNVSAEPVHPTLISDHPGVILVEMPDGEIMPGASQTITVAVDPNLADQKKKTSFTIAMSDVQNTHYTIPVEIGDYPPPVVKPPAHTSIQPTKQDAKPSIRPTETKKDGGS